jgi:hypothetical protein
VKKKNRIILGALTVVELQCIYNAMITYNGILGEDIAAADKQGIPCHIKEGRRRILRGVTRKIRACFHDQCNEENSD